MAVINTHFSHIPECIKILETQGLYLDKSSELMKKVQVIVDGGRDQGDRFSGMVGGGGRGGRWGGDKKYNKITFYLLTKCKFIYIWIFFKCKKIQFFF